MSIKLEHVIKTYHSGEVNTYALRDVSLEIENGELVVLLGPSGSGKSTMLNVCSGLDNPSEGKITVNGEVISDMNQKELTKFRRNNLGFIFQQYNLLQTLTVKENVEVGKEVSLDPLQIEETLKEVGLDGMMDKYPYQLSGGEQQRVSIARAIVKNPKIMFCDEPTGALDEETAKGVLSVIERLNKEHGTTVVLITHNPNIAMMADKVIKLNSGKVVDVYQNMTKKEAKDILWG